jgi:hypothetical protein
MLANPMRAIVMLSRVKLKAGGPETGKLSMPADSVGSGSRPAAISAERAASTPGTRLDDGASCGTLGAPSNVSGSASATPGIAASSGARTIHRMGIS